MMSINVKNIPIREEAVLSITNCGSSSIAGMALLLHPFAFPTQKCPTEAAREQRS